MTALHAALLAADSATAVLEGFFGPVTVQRVAAAPSANAGLRDRLRLSDRDEVRHRAVRLLAGATVLSEAELWYVANRLPAAQVAELESSSVPFGRVMRPVRLRRVVLLARVCGPEETASLEHRALLTHADGTPVAEVYERYARSLLPDS